MLDGQLTVHAGADRFELGPGGIGVVPTGVAHTFRVNSDTARVLVLSTPAGIERFVRDGSAPATSATLPPPDTPRPTPERLEQIFRTHRQVNLGTPLARTPDAQPSCQTTGAQCIHSRRIDSAVVAAETFLFATGVDPARAVAIEALGGSPYAHVFGTRAGAAALSITMQEAAR